MKFRQICVLGMMAASGLFAMSCSNNGESGHTPGQGQAGDLKITLAGQTYGRAMGTPSNTDENEVKKFTVFVFNSENGTLEATQTFTNQTTGTMSGLSTGFPKTIVVVTNAPSNFPVLYEGDPMSKLQQGTINLSYQTTANIATNGMVMVGQTENPVTLSLTGTTTVPVTLNRLAAKITLGSIKLLPLGNYEIEDFEVTGVSIQRAVSSTDIFGNRLPNTSLFGGVIGSMSLTQQSYLYDAVTTDFEVGEEVPMGNYFYVLPNQLRDEATLLTLVSKYGTDEEQYFPIPLNTEVADDPGENTDGNLIESNKSYILHIVINNLGEGTTDPDLPPATASVEVVLTPEPWALDIIQRVTW